MALRQLGAAGRAITAPRARAGARDLEVIDLPGLYDLNGTGLEERVARLENPPSGD